MVSSQPSFMPRFSAAMDGCFIHVCMRCTVSSWRLAISARMADKSSSNPVRPVVEGKTFSVALTQPGSARLAAPAAAPTRKPRRSNGLLDNLACALPAFKFFCSDLLCIGASPDHRVRNDDAANYKTPKEAVHL